MATKTTKSRLSVRWDVHPDSHLHRYADEAQVEVYQPSTDRKLALTYDSDTGAGGFTIKQPSGRQLRVVWNGDPDQLPVVTYIAADGRGFSPGGHLPEWAS